MDKDKMTRAALGQVVPLGHLYDAHTDNFRPLSLFSKNIPESAITRTDNHFADIHLMLSDNFSEKFTKWNVDAELQVSVLSGLCGLKGSGRFLSEQKSSSRTFKGSLLYNIQTKEESFNVHDESLREAVVLDNVKNGVATHVVVGISWGANTVVTCEHHSQDDRDAKEIEGSFLAQVQYLQVSVSGDAKVGMNNGENTTWVNFDIRVFGDVVPDNQDLPTTMEAALNLMKQVPSLVAKCNEGKGKPLMYHLCPLYLLKDSLKLPNAADSMIRSLEEASLLRVVQVFEQMSQFQQRIYDYHQDALHHSFCISPDDINKIATLKGEMDVREAQFRSLLATTLADVRSSKAEVSQLEKLLEQQQSGDLSLENLCDSLRKFHFISEKMSFAKTLIQNGVKYIGYGASIDEEILKSYNKQSFILFFKEEAKIAEPKVWQSNWQMFLQEVKKGRGCSYYFVDCDIHPKLWPPCGTSIQMVHYGEVVIEDLVSDRKRTSEVPIAQSRVDVDRVLHRPNKRTKLAIPCPGKQCDASATYQWKCAKCGDFWEFGFDDDVYCSCGRTRPCHLEFKCPHSEHGAPYETFQGPFLKEVLNQLRPFKERNILILGETGVGKSTWINAFFNYLKYNSLEEAELGEVLTVIPSRFAICNEDFEEVVVCTGTDDNEVQTEGQSATQECRVYLCQVGDTVLRLIDTPGIGDTRGLEADKRNLHNIMGTLSYLEELHGICILLKPNSSKLTVLFRFCIKELLTYLHRDASYNIVFCFTNSRGTFYRPGETLAALRKLLNENKEYPITIAKDTMYCFDSESYRFLAAQSVKYWEHPVNFSEEERANFAQSWNKSKAETMRMLKHIGTLPPHLIKSTLNLNHARQLVVQLTRPLAEISKMIRENREVLQDHLQEIERTEANIQELEKKRFYPKEELEIIRLDYPRTVCTNINCKTIYGPKDAMQIDYRQVCHDHCSVKGVARDTIGNLRLMTCSAMKRGFCRHRECQHSYKEHMHIYYNSKVVTKMVENASLKVVLNENLTAVQLKQRMIDDQKAEIAELDCELKRMQEASVRFACFLKRSAIVPYNDAMLEYLDHLIREEESKVRVGGTDKSLKSLEEWRDAYKMEISILEGQLADGDWTVVLTTEEVEQLIRELCDLKHNKTTLKNALMELMNSWQNMAAYQEIVLGPFTSSQPSADPFRDYANHDELKVALFKDIIKPREDLRTGKFVPIVPILKMGGLDMLSDASSEYGAPVRGQVELQMRRPPRKMKTIHLKKRKDLCRIH